MKIIEYDVVKSENVYPEGKHKIPTDCFQISFEGTSGTDAFILDQNRPISGTNSFSFSAPNQYGKITKEILLDVLSGTCLVTSVICTNFKEVEI